MKMQKIQENSNIHIAFHVPNENTANRYVVGMKESLEDAFGQYHTLVESQYVHEIDAIEFIYQIQCPILMSAESLDGFFQDLMKVFNAHSKLHPHFTQFSKPHEGDK